MTQRNFELAMRKGYVGESIIRNLLESKGWTVYQPVTEGAHCFDMMSIKGKESCVAIDVKSKTRLNYWPATGVDVRHFNEYKKFSEKHNMPFWIIFVDEGQKTIYGATIDVLEKKRVVGNKEYPFEREFKGKPTRVWPLAAMTHIASLTEEQSCELSSLSQRSYGRAFA